MVRLTYDYLRTRQTFRGCLHSTNCSRQMRTSVEIRKLIVDFASADERVRAVLLNGSRANMNVKTDNYQDFDIVYFVTDLKSWTSNHSWIKSFGELSILQLPDEMNIGKDMNDRTEGFHYLMLFDDGNRIDLTLFPIEKLKPLFHVDSLTVVWLDKDELFKEIPLPDEKDYLICRPTQREFSETCNEFWWVSTYVAKGLVRKEIPYAKEMLETAVRPMFMKMIAWHIGIQTHFQVSFGKGGKFMTNYLSDETCNKILMTYADFEVQNNWEALFVMTELFGTLATSVASSLKFHYNQSEEMNVLKYLNQLYHHQ
jgi:aminoglycoside 6-adenylyltransferase